MDDYIVIDQKQAPQEDTTFYLDVGPFFDRFEAAQFALLGHSDAVLRAFIESCKIRKWIYTKHPAVAMGIDRAISLGVPGVDAALKDRIINTPARYSEQAALIALYFPEQQAEARLR